MTTISVKRTKFRKYDNKYTYIYAQNTNSVPDIFLSY